MVAAVFWTMIFYMHCIQSTSNPFSDSAKQYTTSPPNHHHVTKVHNLNELSADDVAYYENIFLPNRIHSKGKYHHEHNVHVVDEFGQFFKLNYTAKHVETVAILKMNQIHHRSNIESLQCKYDENNTIELYFKSDVITMQYYHQLTSRSVLTNTSHFIVAGHEWKCRNKDNHRFESILREIIDVNRQKDETNMLILTTKKAKLIDIFESLDIEYSTNIGVHHGRTPSVIPDSDYVHNNERRLLLSWFSSIWPSIINGITAVYERIESTVEIMENVAEKIIEFALGEPVNFTQTTNRGWNWNYDALNKHASNGVDLSTNAPCINCYAYLNLEYYYSLKLDHRKIKSMVMFVEGDAKINLDIITKQKMNASYTASTAEIPIPDFSFSVAGITFGLFISGQMIIEAAVESNAFAFQFDAGGHVKKGIEYDGIKGTQNYINEHDFDYHKRGPKLAFQSANVLLSAQPILYFTLEHVGSVYFGVKAQMNLAFDTHSESDSHCAVYFTPSASSLAFIGAKMTLIDWDKRIPLHKKQSSLPNWSGCISQSTVTQIQTVESSVTSTNVYGYNWSTATTTNPPKSESSANTFVDLSDIDRNELQSADGWGSTGTHWWANMSSIAGICDDWIISCANEDNSGPLLSPDAASLMLSVVDSDTLIAIYHTWIEITLQNGSHPTNITVPVYTNVSCIARHELKLQDSDKDDIPTYDVNLLEWRCDTNLELIGIDEDGWQCMISLPSCLNALQLDSSFGNIMLFDETWCSVFSMTKKPEYALDESTIANIDWDTFQYPSPLWYGLFNCHENESTPTEMYWLSYNYSDGFIDAVFVYDSNESYYLFGSIDLITMTMTLDLVYSYHDHDWTPLQLTFIGIIKVLYDGTMSFSGSVNNSGCTGFVFQGYLNMKQFDVGNEKKNNGSIPGATMNPIAMDSTFDTTSFVKDATSKPKENVLNSMMSVGGMIMFMIGMVFSVLVFAIISVIRIKRKKTPVVRLINNDDGL